MKNIVLLFTLILHFCGNAQNIDSLQTAWKDQSAPDSLRLDAMDQMVWSVLFTVPDSAQGLALEMREFCETQQQTSWVGRTYFLEGVSIYVRGRLEEAQKILRQSLEYYDTTQDARWIARSYNVLGMSYRKMGDQEKAYDNYQQAQYYGRQSGDIHTVATILSNMSAIKMEQGKIQKAMALSMDILALYPDDENAVNVFRAYDNIAQLFEQQGNHSSSLDYKKKSLRIKKLHNETIEIGLSYTSLGQAYYDLGDSKTAQLYFDSSLTIGEDLNNLEILSRVHAEIGVLYRDAERYEDAIDSYNKSWEAFKTLGFKFGETKAIISLAEIYLITGEYEKGEKLAKLSREMGYASGNPEAIAPSCKILHKIYDHYGHHKDAYDMYNEFVHMRDSIANRENDRTLVRQEEKYIYEKQRLIEQREAEQKEAKLKQESLEAQNELLAQEAERKRLIYGIIGLALLAALVIAILLVMRLRKKRDVLKKEKAMQLKLSEQLVYWQEEERKRVAHDLHDGLGQRLSIIKNTLQGGQWSKDDVVASVGQAIQEVRNVSEALRPRQLDMLGLSAALEELIDETFSGTEIDYQIDIDAVDGLLDKDEEVSIYRIVQEATNNIIKYAECSKTIISIQHNPGQSLYIKIEDDGKGFSINSVTPSKNGGFGLRGMQERVNFLQGQFDVTSLLEEGTLIQIVIPVDANKKRA